jgi:hypothetical protein
MATLSASVGGSTVTLGCDDDCRPAGEWFLRYLEQLVPAGSVLGEVAVNFSFSRLSLRREGRGLVVVEPDFDRDPMREVRSDVSFSLRLQGRHLALLRQLGVAPMPCMFDKVIGLEREVALAPRVTAIRVDPTSATDSGWRIYRTGEPAPSFEWVPAHTLVRARPVVLDALALPVGVVVQFEGNEIVAVGPPR